jgi:birA, biotin-[acetyl-CoA-carboxylase] ligase region
MMLSPDIKEFNIIHIEESDSTNRYLRELSSREKPANFTTVKTGFQTAGRGQRGNSWESEKEKNLLFSILVYPSFLPAKEQFLISQAISLSIKEELDNYAHEFSIKWPNDIYWRNKKICGILIENDLSGMCLSKSIIGIGININQESFRSSAPNPVSLKQITGKENNKEEILGHILVRFAGYFDAIRTNKTQALTKAYYDSLFRKEGIHRFADKKGEFNAAITRVEPNGTLVLTDDNNLERRYTFKEIRYLL